MSRPARTRWLFVAAAITALAFAAATGHAWEDYFITFRSSLNLATGHGLVFQPGERVHTFTSPLGTLLPALFALGGGDDVALRALWAYRVLSAGLLGASALLLARTFAASGFNATTSVVVLLALAFDPKIAGFSINGMESALLVFFITLTWHGLVTDAPLLPALGFAGLQWTRPDGCVFFGVLALGWLLFGPRTQSSTPTSPALARPARLVRAVLLGSLLYLPWIVFAWLYYGSPVPHTILAKIPHHAPGELLPALLNYPWRLLVGHVALHDIFLPTYFYFGGWPDELRWFSRLVATAAAIVWVVPRVHPAGRVASFALCVGGLYVEYIPRSPWYYPGWQILALIALGAGLGAVVAARSPALDRAARITALLLVSVQAALFGCAIVQLRAQQQIVEDGHRREIGRWLRTQAQPRDTVFTECLGYLGYYSQLKMLDYPGLASPEVVAARRSGHRTFAQIIAALGPDWLVLRPHDAADVFRQRPELQASYQLARRFDVRREIDRHRFLPGRGYLEFDAVFFVYRRSTAAAGAQPAP